MTPMDQAAGVRPGEQLDLASLHAFLAGALPDYQGPLSVRQFPHGYSNLTYLLNAGGRGLVLRRPPHGTKAKSAHDMGREFRVLSALHPVWPRCPRPLAFCQNPAVMGCDFYLMERIEGIIPRRELPPELPLGPEGMEALTRRLVEVMADLHRVDYQAAGLGDFGRPAGYVGRQVQGWSRRYRNAKTPDVPDGETVMEWLAANMPAESGAPAIIHNDFKLDNVVLSPQAPPSIIGVLDWEMATIGDPLMDLACTLAYWSEATDPPHLLAGATMPTHLPGSLTRAQAVDYYGQITGRVMENMDFYHAFGLFRLAVIAQQIYYRYFHGQTKDARFAPLAGRVAGLLGMAEKVTAGRAA